MKVTSDLKITCNANQIIEKINKGLFEVEQDDEPEPAEE